MFNIFQSNIDQDEHQYSLYEFFVTKAKKVKKGDCEVINRGWGCPKKHLFLRQGLVRF